MPRTLRPILLSLLLLVAAGCGSKPTLTNFHTVDDGVLVRSAEPDAVGLAKLRDDYGVRTIINLNDQTTNEELVEAMALGIDYLPMPMATYSLSKKELVTVLAAVRQADREGRAPVLIHCRYGQDRTGVTVGLYRVVVQGWDADRAIADMQAKRHWTHRAFIRGYDKILRDAEADREWWLRQLDAVGRVPVVRPPVPYEPSTTRPSGLPDPVDTPPATQPEFLLVW